MSKRNIKKPVRTPSASSSEQTRPRGRPPKNTRTSNQIPLQDNPPIHSKRTHAQAHHSSDEGSSDNQSDDEFLTKLENENQNTKQQEKDRAQMTRRQRMAGQSALVQNVSARGQDLSLIQDDSVLLSLGSKPQNQNKQVGLKKKPQISQKQADENKRQALNKILEDQQKKFKEKEKKMQANQNQQQVSGNVLQGNQMKSGGLQNTSWKPGMEQFAESIKLRYSKGGVVMSMPAGMRVPECIRQGDGAQARAKMEQKDRTCFGCGKEERKYVSKQGRVACSFECYRVAVK